MNYDLVLANIAKHVRFTPEETEFFISRLRPRTFRKKEFFSRAGDIVRYTNFINKGCLRVYYIDENGFEHIQVFAIEDWWISDLAAFVSGEPASYYVDALEETHVWQVERDDLESIYQQIPKFERYFRILQANALAAQNKRLIQNLSAPAEERYLAFRKRYPTLETRIPQKHIAAYLGITPEFLSILKRKQRKS